VPLGLIEQTPSPDDLAQPAFAYMAATIPGWTPTEGMVESRLIEAIALMSFELATLIGAVPSAIFRYFGRTILELPSIDPSSASIDGVVTMVNNAGYTLPAGTHFGLRRAGDQLYAFATIQDVTVPAGSLTAPVTLQAVLTGAATSGLTGPVEFIDAVGAYVQGIAVTGVTTSGVDGETDQNYQDRLRDELTTLSDRLILPHDAEVFARRIAGVDAAVAIDLLNPNDGTTNNPRTMTVGLRDAAGEPVGSLTKTAVIADLAAKREVNFQVFVIDGTYTTVDIVWAATAFKGYAASAVQADVSTALNSYLFPGTWGQTPLQQQHDWVQSTKVRYLEAVSRIDRVAGVDFVTSVLLGKRQAVTAVASTDIFTATAHGIVANQPVVFSALTGGAPLIAGTTYYASTITANTFKVSTTAGGAVVDLTTDVTAGNVSGLAAADVTLSGFAPLPRPGLTSGTVTVP
jgi:hypothetical protein